LGTSADKRTSYFFTPRETLTPEQCVWLYEHCDLAARICDLVPEEALSEFADLRIADDEVLQGAMCDRLRELDWTSQVLDAAVFGRVYGDTFIFCDVCSMSATVSDDPQMPLSVDRVRKVVSLSKVERWQCTVEKFYDDPRDRARFGRPEVYRVQPDSGGGVSAQEWLVHETRMLKFEGARTTSYSARGNNWWHFSVLQRVHDVLRDFSVSWDNAALLLSNNVQGVYKVKGLAAILGAPDGAKNLANRVMAIDKFKSILKSLILDVEEDYEYKSAPLTDVPNMLDRFASRLAAASGGIPVTKLFGVSAAGLNATGEGDRKAWHQVLAAYRRDEIQPQLERLMVMLFAEAGKVRLANERPDVTVDWTLTWPELDQPTELEAAQIRSAMATADTAYITNQVLSPETVAKSRFPASGYSLETNVPDDEFEQGDMLEVDPSGAVNQPANTSTLPTSVGSGANANVTGSLQDTALNGAQVSSLLEIVTAVATRQIPRDAGIAILMRGFLVDHAQAAQMMGTAGASFTPAEPHGSSTTQQDPQQP
jgi:phage-related protein (TIGR01555 family)